MRAFILILAVALAGCAPPATKGTLLYVCKAGASDIYKYRGERWKTWPGDVSPIRVDPSITNREACGE